MNAFVIDAFEFCRTGETRSGEIPVAALGRLAEDTADGSGTLHWELAGGADERGHPQLLLQVRGDVKLVCQRCMTPFAYAIDSRSRLVLARDEEEIDGIEEILDDDEVDVIVGSTAFNVVELIEDEAMLALPIAPKHETCPDSQAIEALKASEKPSAFAALKNLKK